MAATRKYIEKMQKPLGGQVTAYALARERLEAKKAKEARIKQLCNRTGMDRDAATRAVEAELEGGSTA
jgi:hypothetical protein